ncbi:MAG: restriction endonuclease [Planctomycetes bacterium]|nr:restriction endonuclease [Planctomycetota bacterium]
MSADPIIYCLQQFTDYRQFERLCSDVMAGLGYAGIDPLGGTSDRGRDALHVSRDDPAAVTIFAYSMRSDWRRKLLEEDCTRIREEGHALNKLVFVCTSTVTPPQKDDAKQQVRERFGWELELYDLERLRVCLAGTLRHLIARHPSIFCPPWFPVRGGMSTAESRDTLVIDHVPADHALATWLARRLSVAGYRPWCYGTAPLAGESADESVRLLIERRASRYLPVFSPAAAENADLLARCALACGTDGLTIPCSASPVDGAMLATKLRALAPVRFDRRWSEGLKCLLDTLESGAIPRGVDREQGKAIALRSYMPEPVTRAEPERIFANVFRVTVPPGVIRCELEYEMDSSALAEVRRTWACAVASPTMLLAFEKPPPSVPLLLKRRLPECSWAAYPTIEGKRSTDIVKELIKRSLDVACFWAGVAWCADRQTLYFPHTTGPQRNVSYRHVDGRNSRVGVTGERSYGHGDRAVPFRYQLGPSFRVDRDDAGVWWVTMRIYVRITDCDGLPLEGKAIGRRRKTVTKNWWNKEWFARTLGIMQAISRGGALIEVGTGTRTLTVSTVPLAWESPVSIDMAAVERVGDFQEEMAAVRYTDEDVDDADEPKEAVDQEDEPHE